MTQKDNLAHDWKPLYQSAMLELDHDKLSERIRAAREAIILALSQPKESFGSGALRSAEDALQNLRILEKELKSSMRAPDDHIHLELAGEYVAMVNSARQYVAVSDGVCRLLGLSRGELLTKKIEEVTAPTARERVPDTFRQYLDLGYMTGTHELLHRNGTAIPIRYEARVFPDGCLVARWQPL